VRNVPSPEKLANNQWKSKEAGRSKKGAAIQSTSLSIGSLRRRFRNNEDYSCSMLRVKLKKVTGNEKIIRCQVWEA
jgi:hypothetical protein